MFLITVRPGPVLCLWRDGALVAEVPLAMSAALALIASLALHTRNAQPQGPRP